MRSPDGKAPGVDPSTWAIVEVELFVAVVGGLELHRCRSHPDPAGPGLAREPPCAFVFCSLHHTYERIMPDTTRADLYPLALARPDEFRFAPRPWARVVLDFAMAHHQRRLPRDHLLRSLTPLYLWRLAAVLMVARRGGSGKAVVEEVTAAFTAERRTLIARWR